MSQLTNRTRIKEETFNCKNQLSLDTETHITIGFWNPAVIHN